jgi:hypothetical protein
MENNLHFEKHGVEKKHLPPLNMRHDEDVEGCRRYYAKMYHCIEF